MRNTTGFNKWAVPTQDDLVSIDPLSKMLQSINSISTAEPIKIDVVTGWQTDAKITATYTKLGTSVDLLIEVDDIQKLILSARNNGYGADGDEATLNDGSGYLPSQLRPIGTSTAYMTPFPQGIVTYNTHGPKMLIYPDAVNRGGVIVLKNFKYAQFNATGDKRAIFQFNYIVKRQS